MESLTFVFKWKIFQAFEISLVLLLVRASIMKIAGRIVTLKWKWHGRITIDLLGALEFGFIDFFEMSARHSIGRYPIEKASRQVSVNMTAASM